MTQKNQYNSCLVWMSKIIKKQVSYFDTDQIFSQNVVKLLKEIKYIDLENREYSDPIKNYTYLTRYFRTKNRKIEAKKLIGKENRDLLINLIFQLRNEYENSLIINNSNQVERNESKFELKSEESLMNEKIHEQTQKNFLSESASFTIVAINQNDTQTKGTLRLTSSNFQISLINNFNYTKKYQKTNKLKILLSSIDLTLFKINCVKFSFNLKASSEMERMVICKTFQMFQTYRDDISGNCNIDGNILGKKKEITLISKKILQKQETTFIGDLIAKKTEAVMIRLGNKDFVLERENGDLQQFSWENRSFKTRINSKNQVEILISREKEEKQESAIVLQMLSQENALLLARCVVIFAENFSESFAKSEKQMKQKITEYGLEFQNDAEIIQAEIKMMQTREEETRAFVESIVSQLKVPFVTYFNEQDGRPTSIQRRQLYPQIFTSIAVKYENEYDWEMKKEISKWMRTGEAIFYVKTPMFPDSHMKITANGVQLIDSQKRVFLELLFQSGLQMFLHSENSCLFSLISASFRTFVFISEDVQSRDEIFNIFTVFSSLSDLSGEKKFSIQNRGLPIISEVSQYSRWADPDKLEVLSKEFSNKNEIYISRFFVESNENTSIYQEITGGSKNATQSRYHANLIDSFYSFAGKISVLLAKDFFTVEIDLPVSFSYNPYCRAYLNHCEPRFCTLYLDEVLLVNIVFLKRREAEMFATDFAQKSANAIASNPGLSPYQTKIFDCTILSPTGKVNSRIYLDHTYFVIYSQMGRFSSDYLIFNRVKSKNGTTVILDLDSVRYLILLFPNKTLSKQFISHFRMRRMRFLGRGVFEPLFTRFKVILRHPHKASSGLLLHGDPIFPEGNS
ncbi:hypothetical protein M0811_03963 [Anaeramoeba ignava]|uniref:Uncharacterized protein n=1 Tax=Anaeramoeba ignava TaxID=1746090 RepID=A0A9Q0LW57_ANAIG|nr:hypothetical protein M0811_03963 [Anaeramoeba ignava]